MNFRCRIDGWVRGLGWREALRPDAGRSFTDDVGCAAKRRLRGEHSGFGSTAADGRDPLGRTLPSASARAGHLEALERTYGAQLGRLPAGATRQRDYAAYREVAGALELLDGSVPGDRFAQLGKGIAALYSEAIRAHPQPLPSQAGTVWVFGDEEVAGAPIVVADGDLVTSHLVRVGVDPQLVGMPAPEAKRWVLEHLHAGMSELARQLNWPTAPLEVACQHCLERRLAYRWVGPAKHSPDRRHRAIPTFTITDDGLGRAVIEISDRAAHIVTVSVELSAYPTPEGFRRAARTLRWRGNDVVTMTSYVLSTSDPAYPAIARQPTEVHLP